MAQFRCKDGHRLTKYFQGRPPPNKPWRRDPRPPEALRWLVEIRRDDELGVQRPTEITVGEQIHEWMTLRQPSMGASTLHVYAAAIGRLEPLASLRLTEIKANHVQQWINAELAEGNAPKTVQVAKSVLHQAMEAAWQWERLARNPVKHATVPNLKPRTESRAWSAREARHFLEATHDDPYHALWTLLLFTSMRQGAARALRWDDVDFQSRTITVRATLAEDGTYRTEFPADGTGKHARVVIPMVGPLEQALRNHPRPTVANITDGRYIFTATSGRPLTGNQLRWAFGRACRSAGLEPLHPHELRHTAATLLTDAGVPLLTVASILGHTTTRQIKEVYHHESEAEQRKALERLSERLSG